MVFRGALERLGPKHLSTPNPPKVENLSNFLPQTVARSAAQLLYGPVLVEQSTRQFSNKLFFFSVARVRLVRADGQVEEEVWASRGDQKENMVKMGNIENVRSLLGAVNIAKNETNESTKT